LDRSSWRLANVNNDFRTAYNAEKLHQRTLLFRNSIPVEIEL
jgi:hypothetical protein